jgi:hypothetical protein
MRVCEIVDSLEARGSNQIVEASMIARILQKITIWKARRQIKRERLERIRKAIIVAGRSGVVHCDNVGKPPRIQRAEP